MLKYHHLNKHEQQQILQSLNILRHNKEFQRVHEFLMDELNRLDRANRRAEGSDLHRNQGAAQLIERLDELVQESADKLRHLTDQQ